MLSTRSPPRLQHTFDHVLRPQLAALFSSHLALYATVDPGLHNSRIPARPSSGSWLVGSDTAGTGCAIFAPPGEGVRTREMPQFAHDCFQEARVRETSTCGTSLVSCLLHAAPLACLAGSARMRFRSGLSIPVYRQFIGLHFCKDEIPIPRNWTAI